jgi:HPt (histidine-containing phosphotransfer) domain-containing protein
MVDEAKRIEKAPAAAGQPIDMKFLARQTLDDSGLESEVLRLFDEMVHVYFGRLESSQTVGDLLTNLHTIKGAAAGVGAARLAQRAALIEARLRDGAAVDPEEIEDLGLMVEEVSAFIAIRLRDVAA